MRKLFSGLFETAPGEISLWAPNSDVTSLSFIHSVEIPLWTIYYLILLWLIHIFIFNNVRKTYICIVKKYRVSHTITVNRTAKKMHGTKNQQQQQQNVYILNSAIMMSLKKIKNIELIFKIKGRIVNKYYYYCFFFV